MSTQDEEKSCGKCLPYRDPLLISAQALSILGVFFSWSTIVSILFGLAACTMYQVVWCCKMNKCGLITAGVFAAITGCVCIGAGAIILASGLTRTCQYTDDYYYDSSYCARAVTTASSIVIVGGLIWIACAVCTFVFVCGKRFNRFNPRAAESAKERDDNVPAMAVATAVPNVLVNKNEDTTTRDEIEEDDVVERGEGSSDTRTNQPKKKKKKKAASPPVEE